MTPAPRNMTDAQLFDGNDPEENARMVLRKLRSGGLPHTPPMTADWAGYLDEWADALKEFDSDICERSATSWIRTGTNFPHLAAFISWCRMAVNDRAEDERMSHPDRVCTSCQNKNYVTVRVGKVFRDPRTGLNAVGDSEYAFPCPSCPHMANRLQLWLDGHWDPDHEICGRCREYRDPPPPGRRRSGQEPAQMPR